MPVIAFINQKGGVGKTTSAVSVATCLAAYKNKKTLLIDLDQQAQACISFGYQAGSVAAKRLGHLLELVEEGQTKDLPFEQALLPVKVPNLHVLPGQKTIGRFFPNEDAKETLLASLIAVAPSYDWIILDCPPALNIITRNAIAASDWAIVPCEQSVYSVEGFSDFLSAIKTILPKYGKNPEDFFRIVLTKVNAAERKSAEFTAAALQPYADKVFERFIRKNDALNQAPATRNPIFYFDPNSPGALDYFALTDLILAYEETRNRSTAAASA